MKSAAVNGDEAGNVNSRTAADIYRLPIGLELTTSGSPKNYSAAIAVLQATSTALALNIPAFCNESSNQELVVDISVRTANRENISF